MNALYNNELFDKNGLFLKNNQFPEKINFLRFKKFELKDATNRPMKEISTAKKQSK